jgi:Asp-tRNA(Asn)/Glu-tRNA(Gln) amidotransferase A subunit family amidase
MFTSWSAHRAPRATWVVPFVSVLLLAQASSPAAAQRAARATPSSRFRVEETTIADVHAAFRARTLTCRALVQQYLDRIAAYDKRGPAINALIVINPAALSIADSLDARFKASGPVGPLHCIPMIVKDNFETADLQTTAGSLALEGWKPPQDATMVRQIRAAGAIVLAKSNLAEWAFTPNETVSSILPGYTHNPYALDRVTAGSSGGTAAAVAANLGEVGLGSDTGNSIRGPSSHQSLVGIRSTMGLTSRAGVVPLNAVADIAGPMARTVADAVAVFNVVVGSDPADTVTAPADAKREKDYAVFLRRGALKGARIGILRQAYERPTLDAEVKTVFEKAVTDLRAQGAVIVDTARVDSLDVIQRRQQGGCNRFKADLERYFAARGPNAPVKTVDEVLRSRKYHPTVEQRLRDAAQVTESPEQSAGCQSRERVRAAVRVAVLQMMDSLKLDALIYPTWSNPPRLIGDLNTPGGDNSQLFSPTTGFPAITVPMGYTRDNTLPAGMTFFGKPWSEGRLLGLAFDYEQSTKHRRAPSTTPALSSAQHK